MFNVFIKNDKVKKYKGNNLDNQLLNLTLVRKILKMKKPNYLFLICFLFFYGCQQLNDNPKNQKFIDSTNFDHFEVDTFELKKNDVYKYYKSHLTSLSNIDVLKYFQDPNIDTSKIFEKQYRYYSIQTNSKEEKILTILKSDEVYKTDLHYLVYDSVNNLKRHFIVASAGGDGGNSFNEIGLLQNSSKLIKIKVEKETLKDNQDSMEFKIDSTITYYKVDKYGNLKEDDKSHFQRTLILTE